jgi:hypothetical protein
VDPVASRGFGSSNLSQDGPVFHNALLESPRRTLFSDPNPNASTPWPNGSYQGEKLPSLGEMLSNGSPFSPPQSNATSRSPSWMDPFGPGKLSPREYPSNLNDPSRPSPFPAGPFHPGLGRLVIPSDGKGENTWDKTLRGMRPGTASSPPQHERNVAQSVEPGLGTGRTGPSYFSHGYAGDNRPGSSGRSKHRITTHAESLDALAPSDESGGDASSDTTLPKFLCEEMVPGEGLFYFYDDGSRCPAVIEGERVNRRWGITKAGKPRRRLALACVTCRDKKIKCDPGEPKCAQCDKCGRECRTRPPYVSIGCNQSQFGWLTLR